MAKEPTVNNATVNPIPNGGYSFTPQSQTPIYNFAGMDWGYNPAIGDLQRVYTNNGTGSPYGDPQYMSGTSKYGSPNPTIPNTSPYTGGVSASNPFPSHMTNYGSGSRTAPFAFNEAYYQYQNPDVAAAVASGQFPSGYAHYQQYGQNEGRAYSPTSSQFNADPNRIPYSTTNPYEVNPYLNFDVNRAYAVPAPIMNGTWNNLTLPTNIWKPTSYVNQVDQARENAARSDLYNYATPTADTSPNTSINTAPVHANTAGWTPSDQNYAGGVVGNNAMNPEQQNIHRWWDKGNRSGSHLQKRTDKMVNADLEQRYNMLSRGMGGGYSQDQLLNNYGRILDKGYGRDGLTDRIANYTNMSDVAYGTSGLSNKRQGSGGAAPWGVLDYWNLLQR